MGRIHDGIVRSWLSVTPGSVTRTHSGVSSSRWTEKTGSTVGDAAGGLTQWGGGADRVEGGGDGEKAQMTTAGIAIFQRPAPAEVRIVSDGRVVEWITTGNGGGGGGGSGTARGKAERERARAAATASWKRMHRKESFDRLSEGTFGRERLSGSSSRKSKGARSSAGRTE